jgi:hypothetical protein
MLRAVDFSRPRASLIFVEFIEVRSDGLELSLKLHQAGELQLAH